MGRKSKKVANAATTSKPPVMKFHQAAKIADKNSRTIVKILQLMEVTRLPGYTEVDSHKYVTERIATLKRRLNRRLAKLTKYADCSSDDRQSEFKIMTKSSASFARLVQQQKMQTAASRPANSFGFGFGSSSTPYSYPTRDTRSAQAASAAASAAVAAAAATAAATPAVSEAAVEATDHNVASAVAYDEADTIDIAATGATQAGDGAMEEEKGQDEAKSADATSPAAGDSADDARVQDKEDVKAAAATVDNNNTAENNNDSVNVLAKAPVAE